MFYFDNTNKLVYLDSLNVKVFPSGRRKSELDTSTKQYIPIDPEARLNTEANQRKHSGLNGYTQSYILDLEGKQDIISLVLSGYLFTIKPTGYFKSDNKVDWFKIGNELETLLTYTDTDGKEIIPNKIFANILTADTTFFTSVDSTNTADSKVSTEILRDQAFTSESSPYLDRLKSTNDGKKLLQNNATSYYFTGLSFSAEKLETIKRDEFDSDSNSGLHPVSLQIMSKTEDGWKVYEPSRLPIIKHGETENSVRIPGDLIVDGDITASGSVTATEFVVRNSDGSKTNAVTLEVVTNDKVTNQLQFWTRPKD